MVTTCDSNNAKSSNNSINQDTPLLLRLGNNIKSRSILNFLAAAIKTVPTTNNKSITQGGVSFPFPAKLHEMLENTKVEDFQDIVS